MIERVTWDDLPVELRSAVETRTGEVSATAEVQDGLNCSVALILDTAYDGRLFFKGVRETDEPGTAALRCEERINRAVGGISPTVRYRFDAGGWSALAFVYVDGRHADLGPGSNDLDAVAFIMKRMQDLKIPDFPIPQFADRLRKFLEPDEAEALAGNHLLHTDTNPHNLLIGNTGGEAYVVDWAMPAIGPAWVDPANTAVRLMECGQPPGDALAWLRGFASWRRASEHAVGAFVSATCRHWAATVGARSAEPSNERFRHLLG
ncbi:MULTISPECIES: phosphotransferase [Streptomyces]|uniref:Phosphotransferase n=2 Tax=Streptomyces violaceusniger group TaxID=2839105 RepID=A0ABD5J969_9ACTN|nr:MULTISPECIES: phosphotransferase [Streptomyces]MEE4583824.1 phosphotransferase [Streptomyces sp. DSM 41602]AQW52490.1 aminoglycoside phosphotransferase [Streptomyces hygroscopicus]KUL57747.1 aminoglycoside phosphotransferase [Streptomyces violaceusniger]QTI89068.1 phosphotransferase [Streptomyces sp. AgN23]RSS48869.1 aminoglycoside phosphotransferase [Streptomyces sp. WAC05858]